MPRRMTFQVPWDPAFEGTLAPGFEAHILGHLDTPAGGAVSVDRRSQSLQPVPPVAVADESFGTRWTKPANRAKSLLAVEDAR
jgi:hypothetical protein